MQGSVKRVGWQIEGWLHGPTRELHLDALFPGFHGEIPQPAGNGYIDLLRRFVIF
jgi:hypothetical protein